MPLPHSSPHASPRLFKLCLTLIGVIALHLVSAGWHILFGALNPDEGFYAVATRAVAQGEVPYRDFGFTQPPVVLYANALPLRLMGFGLFEQRIINGVWGGLALTLAAVWLARRTEVWCGAALVAFFSLSAPWMHFIHLGKTYAFTSLLVLAATWVFLALANTPRRNFLLGLLAALGLATRLPAAPFFAVLWLLALWPSPLAGTGKILAAIGGVVAGAAFAVLPFWAMAPEAAKFWVFDFQRISVPLKLWHLAWQEIATLAPAVWVLAAFAAGLALSQRRLLTREAGVFLAAAVALGANLLPGGVYEEYGTPFILPLATAAAAMLHDALKAKWSAPRTVCLMLFLAAAHGLTAPVLFYKDLPQRRGTASQWLPYNAPAYNRELPAQLASARRLVEEYLPSTTPFIGPNLILAAETGRAVPTELRLGPFTATDEMPAAQAARLHLATRAQLSLWFTQPKIPLLGLFPRTTLNYNWSMPSFTPMPESARQTWIEPLQRDFTVVFQEGDFLLLLRKNPSPAKL